MPGHGNEAKSECHSVLEDSPLTRKCCTVLMHCVHSKTVLTSLMNIPHVTDTHTILHSRDYIPINAPLEAPHLV